ncbi:hypothetical protein P9J64_08835 [Deltaproteobacteria bacterium IMCC39524]|nr:hypothetical protein [Deltaproteobacteria bacterium IMCC39524]
MSRIPPALTAILLAFIGKLGGLRGRNHIHQGGCSADPLTGSEFNTGHQKSCHALL